MSPSAIVIHFRAFKDLSFGFIIGLNELEYFLPVSAVFRVIQSAYLSQIGFVFKDGYYTEPFPARYKNAEDMVNGVPSIPSHIEIPEC